MTLLTTAEQHQWCVRRWIHGSLLPYLRRSPRESRCSNCFEAPRWSFFALLSCRCTIPYIPVSNHELGGEEQGMGSSKVSIHGSYTKLDRSFDGRACPPHPQDRERGRYHTGLCSNADHRWCEESPPDYPSHYWPGWLPSRQYPAKLRVHQPWLGCCRCRDTRDSGLPCQPQRPQQSRSLVGQHFRVDAGQEDIRYEDGGGMGPELWGLLCREDRSYTCQAIEGIGRARCRYPRLLQRTMASEGRWPWVSLWVSSPLLEFLFLITVKLSELAYAELTLEPQSTPGLDSEIRLRLNRGLHKRVPKDILPGLNRDCAKAIMPSTAHQRKILE